MNKRLFDVLSATQGMYIPLYRDAGRQQNLRLKGRSEQAPFPQQLMRQTTPRQTPAEAAPPGDPVRTGTPTETKAQP